MMRWENNPVAHVINILDGNNVGSNHPASQCHGALNRYGQRPMDGPKYGMPGQVWAVVGDHSGIVLALSISIGLHQYSLRTWFSQHLYGAPRSDHPALAMRAHFKSTRI